MPQHDYIFYKIPILTTTVSLNTNFSLTTASVALQAEPQICTPTSFCYIAPQINTPRPFRMCQFALDIYACGHHTPNSTHIRSRPCEKATARGLRRIIPSQCVPLTYPEEIVNQPSIIFYQLNGDICKLCAVGSTIPNYTVDVLRIISNTLVTRLSRQMDQIDQAMRYINTSCSFQPPNRSIESASTPYRTKYTIEQTAYTIELKWFSTRNSFMTTHGRIIVALRLYEANIHNPNFTIGLPLCWISQDIAKAIHLSKKGNALMAKLQRVARRCNPVAVKARNMGLTLLIPPKSGFKEPLKTATEVSADLKSGGKDSTPVHLRPGDDPKTPPEQKDVHARSRQAFPFWTPRENCPLPRPYEMSLVPSSIISELFTPVELAQDGCNCEFCGEECFWYYYHEY